MNKNRHHFKIKSLGITEKQFSSMSFGERVNYIRKIQDFQNESKCGYLGTKRKTVKAALKEFIALYGAVEYYFVERQGDSWHDDSIQIWYKTK
ncbi:MAG: hypothetical protein RL621_15 [Bacteroidota bacterium]|jgi:hypothetical protein